MSVCMYVCMCMYAYKYLSHRSHSRFGIGGIHRNISTTISVRQEFPELARSISRNR